MKKLVMGGCILVAIYVAIGVAGASDLQTGFLGIPWASPSDHQKSLTRLYERKNVVYYTQPHIVYTIHEIPVPNVVFGFYEDQFFAVYIELENEDVLGEFRNYLTSQYGNPDKSFSVKTGETVYKWKKGEVKIKLKTNEENYRIKLSFYYAPLSQKVNEEQLEKLHSNSLQFFPIKKDEKPEMVPLLRF